MPETHSSGVTAPMVAAAIAGAALIALIAVFFAVFRPDQHDADVQRARAAHQVIGQLNSRETAAVNAAATEMVNLVSFRRAHFEADFQRALNGATGALKSDLSAKKTKTLQTMTKGKFDLTGRVTHKALEGPAKSGKLSGYVVLVTLNGYRSSALNTPVQQSLALTVLDVKGKWLVAGVTNIGVTA